MRKNIERINEIYNENLDKIPLDELTKLYYESRKNALKYTEHGELEKAYKEILRGDNFRIENLGKDPYVLKGATFSEAHREYLDYCMVYHQFKLFRTLLMAQNEKTYGIINVLIEIKKIKEILKEKTNSPEDVITFLDKEYDKVYKEMLDSVDVSAAMHVDLMENEHFKEHNYFTDIDPIGYKPEDLEHERYNRIAGEIVKRMNKANQSKLDNLEATILRLRA